MSSSSIGISSLYKSQVEGEVMGLRPIGCVCNFFFFNNIYTDLLEMIATLYA